MHAQPLNLDLKRIESALTGMVNDGRAAGVSVLIWKDGREAYFGSAGFADREADRRMARDTIVQIYSMTKPVTGVALMQLWEQGKFGLDDQLSRYLPEFESIQVYAGKDAAGSPIYRAPARPISVRDIVRHTAGFAYGPGNTPAHDAFVKADPMSLEIDLAEMGKRLAKVPLLFDPGTRWSYSIAVDVQALLVEKLSGRSLLITCASTFLRRSECARPPGASRTNACRAWQRCTATRMASWFAIPTPPPVSSTSRTTA
jgi:CubicO group peptidase (beta-lactamase class C family)